VPFLKEELKSHLDFSVQALTSAGMRVYDQHPPPPPPLPQPKPRPKSGAASRPRKRYHVLHLFSGPSGNLDDQGRESSLQQLVKRKGARSGRDVTVREVDYVNCACGEKGGECSEERQRRWPCDNLLRDSVFHRLLRECEDGHYAAIVAGIPCNGYCVARFDGTMANSIPLRDNQHPLGLPNLALRERRQLATSNTLTRRSLLLCAAVWRAGGEVLIENPPDYSEFGLWASDRATGEIRREYRFEEQHRHCPLWRLPWVRKFLEATGARLLDFAQCQLQGDYQK
jgi:hypothetical protein